MTNKQCWREAQGKVKDVIKYMEANKLIQGQVN